MDLRWIEPQRQSGINLGLRLMWSTWRRPLRTRTGARRLVPTKGLILPGERECVEPIAAPRRTSRGFKARINRCTILSRTPIGCGEPCRDRFERFFCLRSKRAAESKPGSATTQDSQNGVHSVGVAREYSGQLGK